VAGVDSLLLKDRLEWLDEHWRLKSAKAIDGFIPGEAATALLLEKFRTVAGGRRKSLATVSFCETSIEPNGIGSEKSSSGRGLTNAIEKVMERRGDTKSVRWTICDLNGESYRGFEWGLVQTRLHRYLSDIAVLNHPADCTGDIGAATGGMLIANVAQAFQRGYNPSDEALLWAASDDGLRAALLLMNC
jgi:3-oxoacyl-[acyl-carrier-protein] synthase-1